MSTMEKNLDVQLKLIRLPKDPLASDQEDSQDESPHEVTKRILLKRLVDMPKIDFDIPQAGGGILGSLTFGDQQLDHVAKTMEPAHSDYSPTGNSWNESEIASAYHRYDPSRFPRKSSEQADGDNPQESEKTSNRQTANLTVTSFGDVMHQRM